MDERSTPNSNQVDLLAHGPFGPAPIGPARSSIAIGPARSPIGPARSSIGPALLAKLRTDPAIGETSAACSSPGGGPFAGPMPFLLLSKKLSTLESHASSPLSEPGDL